MAKVVFYEKTGCTGNKQQKEVLEAAGHRVLAFDLRTIAWSKEWLMEFFGDLPVTEWFNLSAPAIKEGAVVPAQLAADAALELLLANPLLIRRPLMQVDDVHLVGFDAEKVDALIGLGAHRHAEGLNGCAHKGTPSACRDPYMAGDDAAGVAETPVAEKTC